MYFTTTLALLAATASAASIPRYEPVHYDFEVFYFDVETIPHKPITSFDFDVLKRSDNGKRAFQTKCHHKAEGGEAYLANVRDVCCEDESVKFSFVNNGNGYNLTVSHKYGRTDLDYFTEINSYVFDIDQIAYAGYGNGTYAYVAGPKHFSMVFESNDHIIID